jgi:hypothetical protein
MPDPQNVQKLDIQKQFSTTRITYLNMSKIDFHIKNIILDEQVLTGETICNFVFLKEKYNYTSFNVDIL